MKSLYQNMVNGTLLGAAMLLGAASCTDDHFDVREVTASGANTIWQNIEANENLDSLSMILKRAKVLKAENDRTATLTYDSLLHSSQQMTVWAPLDGTYNAKYYLDLLDSAEMKTVAGDVNAARAYYYQVSNQFCRNHIARFGHDAQPDNQRIRMMNGKFADYNMTAGTFNNLKLEGEAANLPSANGMLHTINGESPFAYNVYDYIAADPELSRINTMLDTMTTFTFDENASTPGAMNEKGEMVYIDSVFLKKCDILDLARAYSIEDEDSSYVAVFPTDATFDKAWNAVKGLYNYASSYNYDWTSANGGKFQKTGNDALSFNTDSLSRYSAQVSMLSTMFYSTTNIAGYDSKKKDEENVYAILTVDSMLSIGGYHAYNPTYNPETGVSGINPMFDGLDANTYIKGSNGYIFPVKNYKVGPEYGLQTRIYSDISYGGAIANVTGCVSDMGELVTLDDENTNPEVHGGVMNDRYRYFAVAGNNQLNVNFKLNGVLSGRYKISVLMLPNRINIYNQQYDKNGEVIEEKPLFDARVIDDKGTLINKEVKSIEVPQDSITPIVLWEDFKFPYTYAKLPNGYESFPILRLSMPYVYQVRGKSKALSIAAIILEPVREEENL